MQRVDNMAGRLPQLYRDGELLRGSGGRGGVLGVPVVETDGTAVSSRKDRGGLLGVPAVEIEAIDEVARDIQRTHWFDATYDLEHAERLTALLDFDAESWQELDTFRPWVHALRDAMLQNGGVTGPAIQSFVTDYAIAFLAAVSLRTPARFDEWIDTKGTTHPANSALTFIENPTKRRHARFPTAGRLEPLQQFSVTNHGRGAAPASFVITGTSAGRESVPLIANITTGEALIYMDDVPEGKRLWIRASDAGVTATLENEDVTDKLRSITGLVPGVPITTAQITSPARAVSLVRGTNRLWFFPIALFDIRGLDRFLLSMPDLAMAQGRFDTTAFNQSIFYQQPLIVLFVSWVEEAPATFEVRLPLAAVSSTRSAEQAVGRRTLLVSSITEGIERLRAAGVEAIVKAESFHDAQPQLDRLRLVMPVPLRDAGSMGADKRTENAAAFELTSFDESTFR